MSLARRHISLPDTTLLGHYLLRRNCFHLNNIVSPNPRCVMKSTEAEPVYLPHNEPYLGSKSLLAFDLAIPRAMQVHAAIGPKTFSGELSPLQRCATEIIPQGVSIALSIRELIRQAYLFSAAILMRPLVERTGLMQHLVTYPSAVAAWHTGWPRKGQPTFDALFALVMPD